MASKPRFTWSPSGELTFNRELAADFQTGMIIGFVAFEDIPIESKPDQPELRKWPARRPVDLREFVKLERIAAQKDREIERLKTVAALEGTKLIAKLVGETTRIFGKEATIVEDCDPEYPDNPYVVLSVDVSMSADEALKREEEWIRAKMKLAREWPSIRLLVRIT